MRKTDKTTNKDNRITVRLTPNQYFELEQLSAEVNVKKSKLVRFIIEKFIKDYRNATD